jgi:DNA-binding transcriptional MerR regulator
VAALAGVHPNTVRVYEQWGFLHPVPRDANGYRRFDQSHVDQMRLARAALHGGWPGRAIRRSALALVRLAATGDARGAVVAARKHLRLVRQERARAEEAAGYLDAWSRSEAGTQQPWRLTIGAAARKLDLTVDTLRSWERNNLLSPARAANGYRSYCQRDIERLAIIRMLSLAGYSTMAILRFMSSPRPGGDARTILDTPRPNEEVLCATDQWLSTLAEQEKRAHALVRLTGRIMTRAGRPDQTLH